MRGAREVIVTSDSTGESWSAAAWDISTGSLIRTYKNASAIGHHTLTILGDSYIVAAASNKPRLYVWPLNSQIPVSNLRLTTPGSVNALACTRNGAYMVAAIGAQLYVWQLSTGRLIVTLNRHYQTITCLAFSRDGATFVSGGEDGLVFVWSLACVANRQQAATPTHSFSDHSLPIRDVHIGEFGINARMISVSLDCTARIYDANAGTLLLTLIFDVPLTSVCTDLRERDLFVGCSTGAIGHVSLAEAPRETERHVCLGAGSSGATAKEGDACFRGHEGNVVSLSVSADCCTLVSGATDGIVCTWDIPSRQVLRKIRHKGPVTTALVSKHFDNYRTDDLKPKLILQGLQRISDDSGRDDFVRVMIPRGDASVKLLDVEAYLEDAAAGAGTISEDDNALKLNEARAEIERLKKINAAIYRFGAQCLTKSNQS